MRHRSRATLASSEAYRAPQGMRLGFRYTNYTTDGFMRGDVVLFGNGSEVRLIAKNVPVRGSAREVRAMGDYARLFPQPIPVLQEEGRPAQGPVPS